MKFAVRVEGSDERKRGANYLSSLGYSEVRRRTRARRNTWVQAHRRTYLHCVSSFLTPSFSSIPPHVCTHWDNTAGGKARGPSLQNTSKRKQVLYSKLQRELHFFLNNHHHTVVAWSTCAVLHPERFSSVFQDLFFFFRFSKQKNQLRLENYGRNCNEGLIILSSVS